MNNDNAPTAEPVAQGEAVDPLQDDGPLQSRRAFVESWRLESTGSNGHDVIANRNTVRRLVHIIDHLAAQPRAVPDAYVGELIESATEVYRISDREHEAWRRLRAALVAARKAQRPRVGDAAVEPVTQGEQVSPPRYSYGADDSVMLLNPEDSTYTRGAPAASPAGVPDGWKLVPVEPTDDMLAQACTHDTAPRDAKTDQWNRDTWAFMLAAAPSPGESGAAKTYERSKVCPRCDGLGRTTAHAAPCTQCGGTGESA